MSTAVDFGLQPAAALIVCRLSIGDIKGYLLWVKTSPVIEYTVFRKSEHQCHCVRILNTTPQSLQECGC